LREFAYPIKTHLITDYHDASGPLNLDVLLAEAGERGEVVEHFEQTVLLQPIAANIHNNIAELLRHTGRYEEAIEHYKTALRLKPDLWQAYANLCMALNLADRSDEAIESAEHAIEVARAAKKDAVVSQIEEWLMHYRKELERGREAAASSEVNP
jgi:tetratricopeptide (TPR) repeat protein